MSFLILGAPQINVENSEVQYLLYKVLQKVQYNSDRPRSSLFQGCQILSSHCDVVELLERACAIFCIMVKKWFELMISWNANKLYSSVDFFLMFLPVCYSISLLVQTPLELRMGIRFICLRWESWGHFFS